jgi:hypothetical protein
MVIVLFTSGLHSSQGYQQLRETLSVRQLRTGSRQSLGRTTLQLRASTMPPPLRQIFYLVAPTGPARGCCSKRSMTCTHNARTVSSSAVDIVKARLSTTEQSRSWILR